MSRNSGGDTFAAVSVEIAPGMQVLGDVTQIDLPAGKPSGLKEAWRILKDCEGIRFITFTERDVARHRLVQDIITAYERDGAQTPANDKNHPSKAD